tara:strand:- start:180 stop:725 length:546 start_codon:yes stop_codon:yes gene_type:complete
MFTNNEIALINEFVTRYTTFEQNVILYKRFGRYFGNDLVMTLTQSNYINGEPTLSTAAMKGLCLKHFENGVKTVAYFRTIESNSEICTVATRRTDELQYDIPEHTATFTIEDAKKRNLLGKWAWQTMPAVMLKKRATSDLIRDVYPDIFFNVYDDCEITDSIKDDIKYTQTKQLPYDSTNS